MEPSAIQIVTTVVLIAAAGAVALVCDYLRNRSQQLRELALELDARKQQMAATPAGAGAMVSSIAASRLARLSASEEPGARRQEQPLNGHSPAAPRERAAEAPGKTKEEDSERHSAEVVGPALASAEEMTSLRGIRPRRRHMPPPDVPLPKLDDMNPRQALSTWLDQRAAKAPAKRNEVVSEAPAATAAHVVASDPAVFATPSMPAAGVDDAQAPVEDLDVPASVYYASRPEEVAPVALMSDFAAQSVAPEPVVAGEMATSAPVEAPAVEPVSAEPLAAAAEIAETPALEPMAAQPAGESIAEKQEDLRLVIRRALAKRNPAPAVEVAVPAPEPVQAAVPEFVPVAAVSEPATEPAAVSDPVFETETAAAPVTAAEEAPRKLNLFLSTRKIDMSQPATVPAAQLRFEVIPGAGNSSHSAEVALPAGMHDYALLERALASGKPFSGLVISVGVNDVEGRSARNGDLMQSISFFIRGLLEGKEFACRNGEDEFLIVCPGIEGAEAQQRQSRIAEQLWDYQLRGLSTWSILFSWGGADVHSKRVAEAINTATAQMYETRRGRKTVSLDSIRPLHRAAV